MLLRTCSFFALVSLSLSGCAQNKLIEVKSFRLFIASEQPELHSSVHRLTHQYNEAYGANVLRIVSTEAESNSVIHFQNDLRLDGQKLGTGQWLTTTTTSKAMSLHGEVTTNRVEFGMEIVFDEDNFLNKSTAAVDQKSDAGQHLYHLFCHEIGHGMQMNHSEDRHSVMYPTIPERPTREIDYDDYFERAKAFAGQPKAQGAQVVPPAPGSEAATDEEDLEDQHIQTLEDNLR